MEQRFCGTCGAERAHGGAFCHACGTRVDKLPNPGAPAATDPPAPQAAAATAPVVLAAGEPYVPASSGGLARCSNCGRPTTPGADRCAECGPAAPLPASWPAAGPLPRAPVSPTPAIGQGGRPLPPPLATPAPFQAAATGPKPGPPPWIWLAGAAGVVLVVVLVVAVVVGSSGHTMGGTITVYDDDSLGCDLSLGYQDMHEGARVIVTDSDDEVIASSTLDAGEGDYLCVFPFTVEDIPDRDEYWIEVGDRGELHYEKSELEDMNWELDLNLGID